MIRIERRPQRQPLLSGAATLIAMALALALAAVIFALTDTPVRHGYELMLAGAFGSRPALGATLAHASPLILTGLAVAIALRVKLCNLGGEGQFQAGALAALATASSLGAAPGLVTVPLMVVAGAFAGALLMLVPAVLKVKRGTDEAVVTLLLNVMMALLVPALLAAPHAAADAQSRALIAVELFPRPDWLFGAHVGLLLALGILVVIAAALPLTLWGFQVRATDGNAVAARFAGIKVDRVIVGVGLIAGALAGIAGAMETAAHVGPLTPRFGAGTGYAGIAVAVLAGRSWLGLVIAALFLAALQTGSAALPAAAAGSGDVLVALTLMLALIGAALVNYRLRPQRPETVAP